MICFLQGGSRQFISDQAEHQCHQPVLLKEWSIVGPFPPAPLSTMNLVRQQKQVDPIVKWPATDHHDACIWISQPPLAHGPPHFFSSSFPTSEISINPEIISTANGIKRASSHTSSTVPSRTCPSRCT